MSRVTENEKAIIDHVNKHGFVSTDSLAAYFKMTPQSIRRYTKCLADRGMISRSHGGVAKVDLNVAASEQVTSIEGTKPLKIKSLSLICFEPFNASVGFTTKLIHFLNNNSRIEPLIHIIIETTNTGWAANDADKILRKITRPQVAIFCKSLTQAAITVAHIARKRDFETFLICQENINSKTFDIDLLIQQDVGLLSFEKFKDEWRYARV